MLWGYVTLAPPQPGLRQLAPCWTEIYLAGSEAYDLDSSALQFPAVILFLAPSSHWTVLGCLCPPSGISAECHLACFSVSVAQSLVPTAHTLPVIRVLSGSSPHLPNSPRLLALHTRLKSLLPWPHNPPRPGSQVSHVAAGLATTFLLMPLNLSRQS